MKPGQRLGRHVRDQHRKAIAADEPPCYLCGGLIDYSAHWSSPESFTIDHITPISRGGTDTLDNIAAAHRGCNRAKSNDVPVSVTFITDRIW